MLNLSNWSNVPVLNNYHKALPATPGIYVFLDSKGAPAYVGQSVNLRDRHSNTHHALGRAYGAGVQITTVCWQESNSEESLCELECAAYSLLTKQSGCYLNIADPCAVREVPEPYRGPNADLKELLERYVLAYLTCDELKGKLEDLKQVFLNYARSGAWDGERLVSELGHTLTLYCKGNDIWLVEKPDDLVALNQELQAAKAKVKYLEEQVNKRYKTCEEQGLVEKVKQPKTVSFKFSNCTDVV